MSDRGTNDSLEYVGFWLLPTVSWEEKKEVPPQAEVTGFKVFSLSKFVSASMKEQLD